MKKVNLYSVETKNTNDTWRHQYNVFFSPTEDPKEYEKELNERGSVEYRVVQDKHIVLSEEMSEILSDLEYPEKNEVEESEDDAVEETTEEESQINYDFEDDYDKDEFPIAWWRKKRFVAKDGTVFKYKKEQPELYRKFEPTDY